MILGTGGGINKRNAPKGAFATAGLGVGYVDSPARLPWEPRKTLETA